MKEKICKLVGHKVSFHDSQYPVCDRCGAHGYLDEEKYEDQWHYWPLRILEKFDTLKAKLSLRKNQPSDDDIPF